MELVFYQYSSLNLYCYRECFTWPEINCRIMITHVLHLYWYTCYICCFVVGWPCLFVCLSWMCLFWVHPVNRWHCVSRHVWYMFNTSATLCACFTDTLPSCPIFHWQTTLSYWQLFIPFHFTLSITWRHDIKWWANCWFETSGLKIYIFYRWSVHLLLKWFKSK